MAGEFHLDAFRIFEARVVLAQYLEYFRTAEFGRHRGALGQLLAQLGAGHEQPVPVIVRAGTIACHTAALVAPERPIDLERLDFERVLGYFAEDTVCIERAVIAADTGVVAAENLMRTAVVLAERRTQEPRWAAECRIFLHSQQGTDRFFLPIRALGHWRVLCLY
jgi:hypothetical protein